jgi:hypothetical protein
VTAMTERLRQFVLKHYANQDMNHVDFRAEAYSLALESDASIADGRGQTDVMRDALQWLVEAHQNDEPLGRAMDHAASLLEDDAMLDVTSQGIVERCAAICFARAETQSKLQKLAYDEGRNKAGEGHWRAQCELLEAAYAIAALRQVGAA